MKEDKTYGPKDYAILAIVTGILAVIVGYLAYCLLEVYESAYMPVIGAAVMLGLIAFCSLIEMLKASFRKERNRQ